MVSYGAVVRGMADRHLLPFLSVSSFLLVVSFCCDLVPLEFGDGVRVGVTWRCRFGGALFEQHLVANSDGVVFDVPLVVLVLFLDLLRLLLGCSGFFDVRSYRPR